MTNTTLNILKEFWAGFGRLPLYDTGFDDATRGAARADDAAEMIEQLMYLKGYADCARLACPYMGIYWRIAHDLGCIAGTLVCRLQADRDNERPFDAAQAHALIRTFTGELAELCRQKGAA